MTGIPVKRIRYRVCIKMKGEEVVRIKGIGNDCREDDDYDAGTRTEQSRYYSNKCFSCGEYVGGNGVIIGEETFCADCAEELELSDLLELFECGTVAEFIGRMRGE